MKTILIVDDEKDLTDALKVILEDEGYRVLTTEDGKTCLKIISESKPDLVLLDVMIPYLDGYEVLKIIRSQPKYDSLPVIMMSASLPKFSQVECKWQAYIEKPFDLEGFLRCVRSLTGSAVAA